MLKHPLRSPSHLRVQAQDILSSYCTRNLYSEANLNCLRDAISATTEHCLPSLLDLLEDGIVCESIIDGGDVDGLVLQADVLLLDAYSALISTCRIKRGSRTHLQSCSGHARWRRSSRRMSS